MKLQPAYEVLTKTKFNNRTDWDTYPTADYCCDKCSQVVSIDFKSLSKHQLSDFSNFLRRCWSLNLEVFVQKYSDQQPKYKMSLVW